MRKLFLSGSLIIFLLLPALAQDKRLWVFRAPGEAVEYDPATFAQKQVVKIPAALLTSPQDLSMNHMGQMLYAGAASLPLAEGDEANNRKVWLWNGHAATSLTRDLSRSTSTTGSNLAITESAPTPALSADGAHLYWFTNQARRLQRDGVDLSTKTTWTAWQTDLTGGDRREVAAVAMPECSCPTGGCEETCPYVAVWVPESGVAKYFLATQFVSGKEQPIYKGTVAYQEAAGTWNSTPVTPPLRRILDANGDSILEAIPDSACCGSANESDDQVVVRSSGKNIVAFDELAAYRNPDYDVSFYADKGKLSPDVSSVAMTIVATLLVNKPIQLAAQGQASPEELQRIRKALQELPAVEVKSVEETPRRIAFLPHASLVGWLSEKEILIVEGHMLVAYNLATGARRKSAIQAEDAAHVFLR